MRVSWAISFLTALLLFAPLACSRTPSGNPSGNQSAAPAAATPAPAPAAPSLEGEFVEERALRLIMKDAGALTWKEDSMFFTVKDEEFTTRPIGQFQFHRQGVEHLLFLFETAPNTDNDCHACGVVVGAGLFARRGNGWSLEFSKREVAGYNEWGRSAANIVSLIRLGSNRYAIRLNTDNMGQGYASIAVTLNEVAPDFPEVFSELLFQNNEGTCADDPAERDEIVRECYDYGASLYFLPAANPEYDDLIVAFHGTHPTDDGKGVEPHLDRMRYVYRDGKYLKPATR